MNDIESIGMSGSGNSKMPHSHSTPAGVDGGSRTPPTTPRKAGKMLAVRVQMLDDTVTMFQVQAKALGRVLFDQVCKQLHLLEADYFGLEYQEPSGTKYWLDLEKPVCRQVGLTLVDPLLRFCVKFYTPDPAQLEEEFTRYLYCLQIKRDLAQGLLQCNDNTAALMASYIVQAECGDYVIEDYPDHTYLSTYKFVPHQDRDLERRIMENHKKHAGQSPAEADLNLLETARRCELYGMKMHPAKDHEGVPLNLAVAHIGIIVFQNYTKINTFSWAKIRKISFKRKRFLIKLHPEGYGYYKDTVEFFFEGRNECKNFWKKCVENHGFFRCSAVKRVVRQKTRVLSRGSSFRYSGKTQKQIVEFVRDNYVKRQTFQRSNSFRQTSGGRALQGSEGGGYRGATPSSSLMGSSSISAHPLLPLGDPALATPALSLSCGSMTLDSPTTVTSVSMAATTGHRRDDTATSFRTLTSIDVHSPATPSQAPAQRQAHATSQQRISSTGRISPSNSSPPEFPAPRPMPRHSWQRSASCRELYASSFEDSGKARPKSEKTSAELALEPFQLPSQGELDNPVTRYDESNRSYSAASSKLPSLDHDSVPDKVYSSSYPGTSSLSTESGHEESGPVGDLSHDDLSHDSYELLEREHEFEYPESCSSSRDDNEPISDNSDEGIEHEMFQMDSETDSFVKHRSVKPSDRQLFKSVLADLKNVKAKSIDRHSAVTKVDGDYVITESRIQRSNTQIERKFETRHANSVEQPSNNAISHQDSSNRKDPVIMQVQKQKVSLLNELRNLKPKYKITHVDSEILRDEGIMRPKSRIDDDLSPVDPNKGILDQNSVRGRTIRARSIASLEDHPPRQHVETGSLGRGHRSRDRKARECEMKVDRIVSRVQEKERRSQEREERKRAERESLREARRRSVDRLDSRERRSLERLDSRESHARRSVERSDSRELRKSIERLDSRERSCERLDSKDKSGTSFHRGDSRELRKSMVDLDRGSRDFTSVKDRMAFRRYDSWERRERSAERLDSVEPRKHSGGRASFDYDQRHTLERFDSGSRSPFERVIVKESRGKSVERLDSRERSSFDFDPRVIERLSSLERRDSRERRDEKRSAERRNSERKSLEKLDSRERKKSLDRLDSRERRSLERLDRDGLELMGRSPIERLDSKESGKSKGKIEREKSEEKPRERDDWKSLEKAKKDDERRERERQGRLSLELRTDTVIGVPNERESVKMKTVFTEYDPKIIGGVVLGFDDNTLPGHTPVERTKSDPNPARQRLGSNSKRHMLTHQKSIDLTPADSGDEDPFSDGITTQKPNVDIPYTLHKRHVMNGTASDEKSESDSSKTSKNVRALTKDLPKLPVKMVTDVSCLDLTKLSSVEKPIVKLSPDRPRSILISPDKSKTILSSCDKPKSILSPTSKLSPIDQKNFVSNSSTTDKSPSRLKSKVPLNDIISSKSNSLDRTRPESSSIDRISTKSSSLDKKSSKLSPTEPSVTIVSVIEKKRSPDVSPSSRSPGGSDKAKPREKVAMNFANVVSMEIKQELERREKEKLKIPNDSLEKQDSIEKIPLPEIPVKFVGAEKPPLPAKPSSDITEKLSLLSKQSLSGKITVLDHSIRKAEKIDTLEDEESSSKVVKLGAATSEKPKLPNKPKTLEKPSIPEKTQRILDKIESRFSEISKNSPTKVTRPKIIDTGFDDFVDPVADLPLDEVPVKPALELDSLKVPEFTPFMLRPHAEPLRSKSLSLAEEKAPIDTLLSPELETKNFVQGISPKRIKKAKSEPKKDFKKQSKSLEGDKPPLKRTGSKESKTSATSSSKIDKLKLKLGEMPQEIIIIDSTDVLPEVSIVQKGRSKSVTRLFDRSFSTSKDDKEDAAKPRAKSASVDDDLIKGSGGTLKSEKARPKSLGISKSLGSTEKKDSIEKVSPKRSASMKSKPDILKSETSQFRTPVKTEQKSMDLKNETKSDSDADQSADVKRTKPDRKKDTRKIQQSSQELTQSPVILRKSGQTPVLFARARLGLSEGSGIGALQRQGAATQSPTAQRRAKSLDAPVISVHRLPPANAFSSKDDTVDMAEESEDQEIVSDDNIEAANLASKPQSIQLEASPNHRSDSTDHTTVPEMCTDSLSVTETSAQYLESPLTECNEIVTCPDLIPYEQERQLQFVAQSSVNETIDNVGDGTNVVLDTKFIDQSSVESATEQDVAREDAESKEDAADKSELRSKSWKIVKVRTGANSLKQTRSNKTELSSGTDSSSGEWRDFCRRTKVSGQDMVGVVDKSIDCQNVNNGTTKYKIPIDQNEPPSVTVTQDDSGVKCQMLAVDKQVSIEMNDFNQDDKHMVKSPIQISIEECSDEEAVQSDEQEEVPEQENFHTKRRLDSGDTSEDTLDTLDTQVQMHHGGDSELSSPDYGGERTDDKTLVEVELTPEYLEMRKEDEEEVVAEELPEDEPLDKEVKDDKTDNNKSLCDKKLRLSAERSRSDDTNTWTPDREDPDSSSCSIARPLGIGQIQPIIDRREIAMIKESRKEGSVEDESISGSHQVPKVELSSTWRPFPLESSGSSSLEDGWFPPDDNNHHQSQSEDSNGQNEDSFQEDLIDFPGGFGCSNMGPDSILANYGCAFSLSRTLSRISERSTTSEQDKSDLEDSFKPSSRSPSLDDESLMSSDHQPSLSSDPPSGTALPSVSDDRRTSSELPDIPIDIVNTQEDEEKSPRATRTALQLQTSEDWPSPPSSPLFDTPIVSHVETFYMEIKPEEAVKVTVTDSTDTPEHVDQANSDSSDENRTLHDDLHSALLEDGQSSASATTVDGTVKIVVKPKSNSYITGSSHSEDTSMGLSMSEWSSSNNTVRQFCQYSGTKSDDNSLAELGASISDWSGSTTVVPQQYYSAVTTERSQSDKSVRPSSKCKGTSRSPPPATPPNDDAGTYGDGDQGQFDGRKQYEVRHLEEVDDEAREIDEARKFVESQFDRNQFDEVRITNKFVSSPPRIMTFHSEYDEVFEEELMEVSNDPPGPIPEEEEEEEEEEEDDDDEEQLYDNVPAMKYSSRDEVLMEVSRGDSSEDMHERYASLACGGGRYDYDRVFEDRQTLMEDEEEEEEKKKRLDEKLSNQFERDRSEPVYSDQRYGTRSTERPVIVLMRTKSTPYYSTTSLSGESTTSSPPMQVRAHIRTKTMTYSSSRSPQSEGDTSSSMDSPGHTPERGQRAFRRKRQQNPKRRHRVVVDLEVKDGQIVSSTDSSFDVASIPPPLLSEQSVDIDDDELSDSRSNGQRRRQR